MVGLIRFIERKTGIYEHLVGKVVIGETTSSVDIHKSVAFDAMKNLEKCFVQNKKIRVDLIRDRPTS
jgi:hypothetical protein